MGSRTGLDNVENKNSLTLPELELRIFGRSTCSESLYRLNYPGSYEYIVSAKYRFFLNC
jgi:hypothetical protein